MNTIGTGNAEGLADSEGPFLLETGGALNIRYRGRLLYSERGPASLARRAAQACETGPSRLYLVLSPGLWYGLVELAARLEAGSAILCLEAEAGLAHISLESLPPELPALCEARGISFAFLASSDPDKVRAKAAELGRFRRCISLRLSGGESFHSREYACSAALLQAGFAAYWRSKAALISMGRLWTRNIFRNLARLPEIAPSPLPRLETAAMVCGAGPSLEGALPFIKEHRERLFLMACDTALAALVESGIDPDLVVCLEGQAHNLPDFISSSGRKIDLLADLSSHPATFGILGGRNYLSAVEIVPSAFLSRLAALGIPSLPCPPLGSVGVHAVHLARRLSPGPVLISGLDFSYERGKTHARGSPSLQAELRRMTRLSRWPGQTGSAFRQGLQSLPESRLTDPALSAYAGLLADELRRPGPPCFDLRGRGLPIGAQILSFAEAGTILDRMPQGGPAPADAGEVQHYEPDYGSRAQAFIKAETARLEDIYSGLKGKAGMGEDECIGLISEADYLLWALPDSDRLESRGKGRPQDLLNRILIEVEYWLWKLEELEETF